MSKHFVALILLSPTISLPSLTLVASANVVGGDTQNFNPTVGSTEFVTVQSSQPIEPGLFHLGLFMNHAINTLPYDKNDEQSRSANNDALTGTDATISFGLIRNLDLGIALPFIVNQSVEDGKTHGEFEKTGNTEVRLGARYRILDSKNFGLALVGHANINRIENNPHTGADTSPLYSLEIVTDYRIGRTLLGANAGYRWREPGEDIDGSLMEPIKDQALLSLAIAQMINTRWTATSEIFSSKTLTKVRNETNRNLDSAEWILGAKYAINKQTHTHAGAGTELIHGLSTPDWRAYAGITTIIGPKPQGKTIVKRKKKKKAAPVAELEDYPMDNPIAEINQTPDEVFILDDIHFEFDSDYRILAGGIAELQKLASHLQTIGYDKLIVEGHTDAYGSDDYNEDLSFRRAKTVRRHLIKYLSMPPKNVMAIGYGEDQPRSDNITDRGRQENRRVEVKIFK